MSADESRQVAQLVTTKPEAEIAADLKARVAAALIPICALMDEAAQYGLVVRWDGIAPTAPFFRFTTINLRIEKHY